jgi:hypothetical protein
MRPRHGKPGPSTEGLWTIVANCLNLCRITTPVPGQLASRVASCLPMLFVHGIRAVGNVENSAIAGSGAAQFPDAPPVRHEPTSYPHLTGHYVSLDL